MKTKAGADFMRKVGAKVGEGVKAGAKFTNFGKGPRGRMIGGEVIGKGAGPGKKKSKASIPPGMKGKGGGCKK